MEQGPAHKTRAKKGTMDPKGMFPVAPIVVPMLVFRNTLRGRSDPSPLL